MEINPEDIPCEIVEIATERFSEAYWGRLTKQDVAWMVEDLIEAGLVSPPVYCVRWDGELQILEQTDTPRLFPGKPWAHDQEHYKGQTS